jgi:hypothetical protein
LSLRPVGTTHHTILLEFASTMSLRAPGTETSEAAPSARASETTEDATTSDEATHENNTLDSQEDGPESDENGFSISSRSRPSCRYWVLGPPREPSPNHYLRSEHESTCPFMATSVPNSTEQTAVINAVVFPRELRERKTVDPYQRVKAIFLEAECITSAFSGNAAEVLRAAWLEQHGERKRQAGAATCLHKSELSATNLRRFRPIFVWLIYAGPALLSSFVATPTYQVYGMIPSQKHFERQALQNRFSSVACLTPQQLRKISASHYEMNGEHPQTKALERLIVNEFATVSGGILSDLLYSLTGKHPAFYVGKWEAFSDYEGQSNRNQQ